MNLNLEYYKVFYYVAKYKSITMAAEQLSLSQPAVSQSIRHLEEVLGTPLFVRTAKGTRLSEAGKILFPYVSRGYEYIRLGERKLREQLNLETGEIRIGASDMTLQYYLLEYLERFHERYPKIKVRVTNAPTPETLRNLQEGTIDFGVVTAPVLGSGRLELKEVRKIRDIFVAGEKYAAYQGRTVSLQELEQLPIICLEGETSSRRNVEKFLKGFHVELHPEFELATSQMLVQFARRGLGVASVVEDFAREELDSGHLFAFHLEEEIPSRPMYVVTDPKIPLSVAASRLLEILESWE